MYVSKLVKKTHAITSITIQRNRMPLIENCIIALCFIILKDLINDCCKKYHSLHILFYFKSKEDGMKSKQNTKIGFNN